MTTTLQKIPVGKLIDIFLEVGIVPDAKFHYKWDEYSDWQLNSLLQIGLKPSHKLLDIGCGPIRFGIQAINYLDDGNYFGIDATPKFVQLVPAVAKAVNISKKFEVILNDKFEFEKFNQTFDFANAQSVFTHMSKDQIITCLRQLKKVMKKGGILLFTNIASSYPRGFIYQDNVPMIAGKQCTVDFYKEQAHELGIEFIENTIKHPTQTAHILKF